MEFEYDNQKYKLSELSGIKAIDIYNRDFAIKLPDGRYLKVISWLESFPPIPNGFKEITRKDIKPGWVLAVSCA